ncbi:GntR family transcriptional regulator [Pseudonocardia ailaonensis]|uniref:GntR family transcriptional regulator n=2 Tax=Pseudonocardia ailaonensis TaxID=367279 RepID=A0ABN2N9S7_9PSEU
MGRHDHRSLVTTPADGLAERRTLAVEIADRLSQSIFLGEIAPGGRLNEVEIAKRMGTSRGPVREAFRYLQDLGIIEAVPHHGSFVVEFSSAQIKDLIVLRSTLEGVAARMLIGTRKDLTELHVVAMHLERAAEAKNGSVFKRLEWRFSRALCEAAGTGELVTTWEQVYRRLRLAFANITDNRTLSDRAGRYTSLAATLKETVPGEAEAAVRSHILSGGFAKLGVGVPEYLVMDKAIS